MSFQITAVNRIVITRANAFLRIAVNLLKYLISIGRVTTPTAIRVETKAAIWGYPAPLWSRAAPREKVMKLGIRVIEPRARESITPKKPDFEPISFEMVSGLKTARIIPTNIIIERTSGSSPEKDFQALMRAFFVFSRSFK